MKPEAWDQIIEMAEKHNITWLGLDQNGLTLLPSGLVRIFSLKHIWLNGKRKQTFA